MLIITVLMRFSVNRICRFRFLWFSRTRPYVIPILYAWMSACMSQNPPQYSIHTHSEPNNWLKAMQMLKLMNYARHGLVCFFSISFLCSFGYMPVCICRNDVIEFFNWIWSYYCWCSYDTMASFKWVEPMSHAVFADKYNELRQDGDTPHKVRHSAFHPLFVRNVSREAWSLLAFCHRVICISSHLYNSYSLLNDWSSSSSSDYGWSSFLVLVLGQMLITGLLHLAREFSIAPQTIRTKALLELSKYPANCQNRDVRKFSSFSISFAFSCGGINLQNTAAVIGSHQTFCIYNVNRTVTVTLSLFLDLRV